MSSSPAPEGKTPPPASVGEPGAVKHPAPPSPWAGEGQRSLLRPSTLALLFLAMGFVLVMLFPGENYNDPRYTDRADGVSVAYLRAIVKVRPHDPEPRLVLARQLVSLALLDEAMAVLQPLLPRGRVINLEADTLALDVEERRFYAIKPGDIERREDALDALYARMERLLASRVSAAILNRLARLSLSLDQPGKAAQIYLRLSRFERRKRDDYLELAGRWYLAAGEYKLAAQCLREAAIARRDRPEQAAKLAARAVDALLAGNKPREALKLLEELRKTLGGGPQLLDKGLKLALSVSDLESALLYALLRAASFPNDLAMQLQLRELGLSRHRTVEALQAAQAVVRLRPDDPLHRRRLALVARWSGDLFTSLENWLWLARHGDAPAVDEALPAARALLDWDVLVELLTLKAEREGLSHALLIELTRAYEALANPQGAALAVERWGDPEDRRTWELLAHLHDGAGRDADELAVWQEIERRFGKRLQDVMRQAELCYRLGRSDAVWKLLREARHIAGPRDIEYWRSLADQAWVRDAQPEAMASYRVLWASGEAQSHEIGRLLLLLGRTGQREDLLAVARQAWLKAPNPTFLLMAMQTAAEARLYPELTSLMALAQTRFAEFKGIEHYWLLRAALMMHERRPQEVEEAYRTALVINPLSREARVAWLAYTLDQDRRERMAQLLSAWWELALSDAAYARPYAAALDRLGRLQEALPFYDIEARARPKDLGWLEAYADALSRAGRADGAFRLKELVLLGRRRNAEPVLAAWSRTPGVALEPHTVDHDGVEHGSASPEPVVAYARLLRNLRGDAAAAPITETLLRRESFDPEVQLLALETEIERDNVPAARRWIWRRRDQSAPRPPLSLRLALALSENDHEALAAILASEGDLLPLGDRVTVMRRLGMQAAARKVVAEGLTTARSSDVPALQAHARDLAQAQDDRLSARAVLETAGPMNVLEQEVGYERPTPWSGGRMGVSASHLRLSPTGSLLLVPPESRGQLLVHATVASRRLSAELQLGIEDGPAAGAALRAKLAGGLQLPELGQGSQVQLALSRGESRDGAILRAFGERDLLAATFDLGLTRREQFRAIFELRRDHTSDGAWLARGGGLVLELSHQLLTAAPSLRVFTQAAAAANQRAATLPEGLALRLDPRTTLDSILPARYASFSAGFSLARGELSPLPLPAPLLSWGLELSAGWLMPAGQLAMRGDGTLWWRFLPGHNLGGRMFLSRSQSGRAGETERGLEIRYAVAWD